MHATKMVPPGGSLKSAISPDYIEIDCRHWLEQSSPLPPDGSDA